MRVSGPEQLHNPGKAEPRELPTARTGSERMEGVNNARRKPCYGERICRVRSTSVIFGLPKMTRPAEDSRPDSPASLTEQWKATQHALREKLIVRPLRPIPRFVAGA